MKLQGARVLLTGGSGGIGQALMHELHSRGCHLLVHGHQRTLELPGEGDIFITADITTETGLNNLVNAAQEFKANVLINNAGINQFSSFEDADISQIINTNVIATMKLTQALLPHLRSMEQAVILNVGSTFGQIGFPGYVAYCASKHAIRGFNEALRRELGDTNICVQLVSPRATNTSMNTDQASGLNDALGTPVDEPDDLARKIVNALASGNSVTQVGMTEKAQVKLNSICPGVVDAAIAKQLPTIKRFYSSTTTTTKMTTHHTCKGVLST